MELTQINITIPEDLAGKLRKLSDKDHYIVQAIREKLTREQRAKLEQELAAEYDLGAARDLALINDWERSVSEPELP